MSLVLRSDRVMSPLTEVPELIPVSETSSGLTWSLIFSVVTVTFGTWFPMGYSIAAMNGPQTVILTWIRSIKCRRAGGVFLTTNASEVSNATAAFDSDTEIWCRFVPEAEQGNLLKDNPQLNTIWALSSSALMVGGFLSSFVAGAVIERLGIKRTILADAGLFLAGNLLFCLAQPTATFELIAAGRFLVGFALGVACVAPPVYCSEITPVKLRGAFGVFPILQYVLGMILATSLGLPFVLGNEEGWIWLVVVAFVPPLLLLLLFPFCPESPRRLFLVAREKQRAEGVLRWLRRNSLLVIREMKELESESQNESAPTAGLLDLLRHRYYRSVLALCVVPMLAQQMSGFSCVSFYSTAIFTDVGLDRLSSIYASIGLWLVYLLFSLVCMLLVDRLGRRPLLMLSHAGMVLALTGFVVTLNLKDSGLIWMKFVTAACIPLYIAFYSLGSTSIPWFLPSEMFAQEARAAAVTWISVVSWGAAVVTTLGFPLILAVTHDYTFLIFVVCVVLATLHIYFKLPETKGKTIEQVQALLRQRYANN
ncbi:solute carrier family 2, facilitated glucose transporter member 1-like [Paramacrobiotus metropolitanus]|uniref:solute carrier family 2, facilitated glucose transporter member 1-like n=1 Tax=Paramacrobiotus metropolitanus TaxID=2943436 RepID=UPI002445D57A|nr:solute carrier family 2, facilitated glucose transporter member 1-like [Paramacrobiotus metropolitanus]